MLVSSVCAQQVNLAFAFTLRARLVRRFGEPLLAGGQAVYAFPEPAVLAGARVADLRGMQLTTRKAEYVVGVPARSPPAPSTWPRSPPGRTTRSSSA